MQSYFGMSARLVIMVLFSLAFEKTDTGILAANAVTLVEFYIPLVIVVSCVLWLALKGEKCAPDWLLISVPSSASDKTLMVVQPVELRS